MLMGDQWKPQEASSLPDPNHLITYLFVYKLINTKSLYQSITLNNFLTCILSAWLVRVFHACMYVWCLWRSEDGVLYSGTTVMEACEPSCGC